MTAEATPTHSHSGSSSRNLLHRWPTVVGLAFAAFNAIGMTTGLEQAPVLVAALVVYVGAAALGRQGAAWPLFFGTVVVITLVRVLFPDLQSPWVLFGLGALLLAYGLIRRAFRPLWSLPLQTLLMVVIGGLAAIGLLISTEVGGYLVALGLLAHAGLDVYLFKTNRVVARSMAEFCFVLDATLAVAIVVMINLN